MAKTFKITLLRPPIVQLSTNLSAYGAILPIGLGYIAAVLRQAGHEVLVIDAPGEAPDSFSTKQSPVGILSFQGLMPKELVERIPESTEILGITHMFLHEWPTVKEIAERAKKRFPEMVIVLGGENATAFWRQIFTETSAVDYCVLGEGESTVLQLLKDLTISRQGTDTPAVASRLGGITQEVRPGARISDLKKIPRPAWDLFPVESYLKLTDAHGVDRGRSMPILATRGCPYDCTFCSSPKMWTHRYETRPPEDVVAEIRDYVAQFKIKNINFCDLTAIIQKEWILEFCHLLGRESFRISWQLPTGTRTEALDGDVLARMYQTGCRNITYAPESGSKRMLTLMKKRVNLTTLLRSLRSAVKRHLVTRVNIIIGHPQEVRKDVFASLLFLVKAAWLGCDDAAVMIFTPYPGSEDTANLTRKTGLHFGENYYYLPLARSGWSSRTYNPVMGTQELLCTQYGLLLVFYALAYLTRPWRILKTFWTFAKGTGERTQLDQLLRTKFKKTEAQANPKNRPELRESMDYSSYWEKSWENREKRNYYPRLYGELKHRLSVTPGSKVLDVGGGDGHFMHYMGQEKADILDISDSGLRVAARHGFSSIKADLQKSFPVNDGSYDVAFCFEVLEHLHFPEVTVSETFKALKDGGVLYVGQPNMRADGTHHVRRFYKKDILDLLTTHGFKIDWIDYVPGFIVREAIWDDIRKTPSWFRKGKQTIALGISLLPRKVLYLFAKLIPNRFALIFVIKAIKVSKAGKDL